MTWRVEFLDDLARSEFLKLPRDMQAKFEYITAIIRSQGIENVHEPQVKHLEGPLWEIRMQGRDGIARAMYVTAKEKRVVVVRVFVKKTQKTPRSEIKKALKRAEKLL
jgi:phage-related protein